MENYKFNLRNYIKLVEQNLPILTTQYHYEYHDLGNLGIASWVWDSDLKPLILVSPDVLKINFSSEDEKHKFFFDDFFGLFPHEYKEAVITKILMTGNLDIISK